MLFNSYKYLLLFLPISLIVYFILNYRRLTKASKIWLVLVSYIFLWLLEYHLCATSRWQYSF